MTTPSGIASLSSPERSDAPVSVNDDEDDDNVEHVPDDVVEPVPTDITREDCDSWVDDRHTENSVSTTPPDTDITRRCPVSG